MKTCMVGIGMLLCVPGFLSGQRIVVPSSEVEWEALGSRLRENPYLLTLADRDTALTIVVSAMRTRDDGLLWAAYGPGICVVRARDRAGMEGEARREAFRRSQVCLERILAEVPSSTDEPEAEMVRGMLVRPLAEALFEAGDLDRADSLAASALRGLPQADVRTRGDTQYQMNQLRGRVALRRQQREEALEFLRRAGESESTPRLSSFGPGFSLARELLEVGEREAVLSHLDAVERFWNGPDAKKALAEARRAIRAGAIPDGVRWW